MVAPITLNVRHIRGHTFTVEVDHDADTLGLKVVIWESQHIAIDQQRLVFGGKELEEGSKLSAMGISDGAQIFLVEAGDELGDVSVSQVEEVPAVATVATAVVPPAFAPESDVSQSGSFAVQMPAPHERYELVSDEEASNERISAVIDLAKLVRVYCIFGFTLTLLATIFCCYWSAIVALIFLLGWIGTRKLNRCLLVFPLIKAFLTGFGGIAYLIFVAVEWDELFSWAWTALFWLFLLFVCILHVMIFLSISKLCCRIGKLSRDEWCNARARIVSRHCCC